MPDGLRIVVRTPHEIVLDAKVTSARVPTATGQVGLRRLEEPLLLVVEPGLVVLRTNDGTRFAATAGGLLEGDRDHAVLYTPFAVRGDVEMDLLAALDRALTTPDSELSARKRLGELEQRIVGELRSRPPIMRARGRP